MSGKDKDSTTSIIIDTHNMLYQVRTKTVQDSITSSIIDSYRNDAKAQLVALQSMVESCDGKDDQALLVTALAAENTAKTVRKLCYRLAQQHPRERHNGLA